MVETGVRQERAQRTRDAVVNAAASAFVDVGIQAPMRTIAERAGVGLGTIYRHFPTRADLVLAVYRRQIDDCVDLARSLATNDALARGDALDRWIDAFTDFLVTKHGLSSAVGSDLPSLRELHTMMLDALVPACDSLLRAAQDAGEIAPEVAAYGLMRAVGNLCIVGKGYDRDEAKRMVRRLLAGCRIH